MRKNEKLKTSSFVSVVLSITLIFSILFGVLGCEEKYECPEWFTSEYCSENYTVMSTNYVHSKATKKCVDKSDKVIKFNNNGDRLTVYEICGENIEDYALGYIDRLWGWYEKRVIKSKTNDSDPICDYKIKSAEISVVKCETDNKEETLNYEELCTIMVLDKTANVDLLNDIHVCISEHNAVMHVEDKDWIRTDHDKYFRAYVKHRISDENQGERRLEVVLRVRFEETENIMWQSTIVKFEDQLFLECGECQGNYIGYWYIPLNKAITDYIESILSSNPEIFFE